jgi:hypothetical protein
MWRRDVCLRPEWDWGSKPEYWERKAAEARRGMESSIAEVRAAGWGDACAGEVARDRLEDIEICSINVELLTHVIKFQHDPRRALCLPPKTSVPGRTSRLRQGGQQEQ